MTNQHAQWVALKQRQQKDRITEIVDWVICSILNENNDALDTITEEYQEEEPWDTDRDVWEAIHKWANLSEREQLEPNNIIELFDAIGDYSSWPELVTHEHKNLYDSLNHYAKLENMPKYTRDVALSELPPPITPQTIQAVNTHLLNPKLVYHHIIDRIMYGILSEKPLFSKEAMTKLANLPQGLSKYLNLPSKLAGQVKAYLLDKYPVEEITDIFFELRPYCSYPDIWAPQDAPREELVHTTVCFLTLVRLQSLPLSPRADVYREFQTIYDNIAKNWD